ncbi:hypothetical protein TIFTF001_030665 [Ficus carica]|uniref:SKP1-like protein n=1 Tax=Ficus carica TaxID=3494 RepID=A0AA88J4H0_FICCA|nr:hypothetical protein TIFTF001_030665 [Ficus carica]
MSSSSSSTTKARLITLKTSDGGTFLVDEAVAKKFGFLKQLVDDGCDGGVIFIPPADSRIMSTMLEWCKKHTDEVAPSDELEAWDAEFVKDMDQGFLYHLLLAADYLNGTELVNLLAQKVANMIKGKKAEEIRQIFHIKNDFTPEQEEEIRRKNPWAFY